LLPARIMFDSSTEFPRPAHVVVLLAVWPELPSPQVPLPGEPPKIFKALKKGSSTFERLTWLGFTSNATNATVFYLDNLGVMNEP